MQNGTQEREATEMPSGGPPWAADVGAATPIGTRCTSVSHTRGGRLMATTIAEMPVPRAAPTDVHMASITPQAEKQAERLPRHIRQKLARKLRGFLPASKCRLVV